MDKYSIIAINHSIEHWQRMIDVAKVQNLDDFPTTDFMKKETGETWYGDYCWLCYLAKIRFKESLEYDSYIYEPTDSPHCKYCPLSIVYGNCDHNDNEISHNSWRLIWPAQTWKEWLFGANKMLRHLKSLLNKKNIKKIDKRIEALEKIKEEV